MAIVLYEHFVHLTPLYALLECLNSVFISPFWSLAGLIASDTVTRWVNF